MELSPSDSKELVPGEPAPLQPEAQKYEHLPPLLRGWMLMPRNRQIGIIAALALSLAIAVAMALWAKEPQYAMLFGEMPEKEAGKIVEALEKLKIEHKIDPDTGSIQVPADKVHALRLKLAGMGFPKESSAGFEILDKENGFGVSQLVEGARYQRALEGEIARSIMTIKGVKGARVHLALPKESVFVRQPKQPSASVVLDLLPNRMLEPAQVDAIAKLVASSIPQLEPNQVSVVDQRGRLLLGTAEESENNLSLKQFDYKRQVEEHLIGRVENILSPVMGSDGMRTQVSADVDFTVTERTQEVYNPDTPALRSEQNREEQNRGTGPQGVPGALSNQPPPAGVAPETTNAGNNQPGQAGQNVGQGGPASAQASQSSTNKSATRNYELDKTISHSRLGTGVVRRVTAAVVVDNKRLVQADGTISVQPYTDEELARFTNLVKEAVGYDSARGDRVTVTNAAFRPEEAEPPIPVWEQPWFIPILKYAALGLMLLLLIFGVLRPVVRGLTGEAKRQEEAVAAKAAAEAAAAGALALEEGGAAHEGVLTGPDGEPLPQDVLALENEELLMLEAPQSHEKRIEFVQKAIDQDSKRVAQVIKNWMGTTT